MNAHETPARVIAELTNQTRKFHNAASVLDCRRRLMLIDAFGGYACSQCSCRFPESRPPLARTLAESQRLERAQREREFAAHVCEDRGW
jgi:hypothetical protein